MTDEGLAIRRFTPAQATAVSRWAYPPPYEGYSSSPELIERQMERPAASFSYFAINEEAQDGDAEPIGFCCFGDEARVVGQSKQRPGVLSVGGGIRPDRVGEGIATRVLPAVIRFASTRHRPVGMGVAVAAFNDRSLRLCRSAGFVEESRFTGPGDTEFIELYRPGPSLSASAQPGQVGLIIAAKRLDLALVGFVEPLVD